MIEYMTSHPHQVEDLMDLALLDKQPLSWRSAWLLSRFIEHNDHRIQKYIPKIIEVIPTKLDGHQRDLINILRKMEIDEDNEGILFDICAQIWEQPTKIPSLRYNAFCLILQIAEKHPELINEIDFLMQDHYVESLSPGIKRSIQKMIKSVQKGKKS